MHNTHRERHFLCTHHNTHTLQYITHSHHWHLIRTHSKVTKVLHTAEVSCIDMVTITSLLYRLIGSVNEGQLPSSYTYHSLLGNGMSHIEVPKCVTSSVLLVPIPYCSVYIVWYGGVNITSASCTYCHRNV